METANNGSHTHTKAALLVQRPRDAFASIARVVSNSRTSCFINNLPPTLPTGDPFAIAGFFDKRFGTPGCNRYWWLLTASSTGLMSSEGPHRNCRSTFNAVPSLGNLYFTNTPGNINQLHWQVTTYPTNTDVSHAYHTMCELSNNSRDSELPDARKGGVRHFNPFILFYL